MDKTNIYKSTTSNILLENAFKQWHGALYFYALKFVDSNEAAKDLVQDAFLSILNTNTEIESLKAYLFRSVRNNCLNYLKTNEVKKKYIHNELERIEREINYYDLNQTLIENELQDNLYLAIEELPDHYKIPFKLSRFENLKNKEIAAQLALPVRTVETQIFRALKLLRKKLKGQNIVLFLFIEKKRNLLT